MKKLERVSVSLLALALSCCASYQPPTTGPTAQVKFIGNQYYAYVDDGASCSTRKMVPKDAWSSTYVRAGQRIWLEQGIDTRGLAFGYYCGLALSFEPEADVTYVSEYTNEGMRCRIALFRLTANGAKVSEPTARTEKPRNCLI